MKKHQTVQDRAACLAEDMATGKKTEMGKGVKELLERVKMT